MATKALACFGSSSNIVTITPLMEMQRPIGSSSTLELVPTFSLVVKPTTTSASMGSVFGHVSCALYGESVLLHLSIVSRNGPLPASERCEAARPLMVILKSLSSPAPDL